MDYTVITNAVEFTAVMTGLGVVASSLATVYVAWKGAKLLLGAVK